MKLGIDVTVNSAETLLVRLARLKSTKSVEHGGVYAQEPAYCQLHIDTSLTEEELSDWLYETKGIDYVGVFSREQKVPA